MRRIGENAVVGCLAILLALATMVTVFVLWEVGYYLIIERVWR